MVEVGMQELTAFQAHLSNCEDCRRFSLSSTLERWNFQKPCIQYKTHVAWKTEQIRVLFLAESAPCTSEGYFYEPKKVKGYAEILRTNLLKLLGIDSTNVELALKEFKNKNYFLSDTVKCRCDKGDRSHPPPVLDKNCGRNWLQREINILDPDRICALGKTALEALGVVPGYEEAASAKAGRDCGKILDTTKPVLVWVFPSSRTSNHTKSKVDTFSKFIKE